MENMDKELTVPKWVLIIWPKIPQMPQKFSAQKVEIFEKSSLWMSVVRGNDHKIEPTEDRATAQQADFSRPSRIVVLC